VEYNAAFRFIYFRQRFDFLTFAGVTFFWRRWIGTEGRYLLSRLRNGGSKLARSANLKRAASYKALAQNDDWLHGQPPRPKPRSGREKIPQRLGSPRMSNEGLRRPYFYRGVGAASTGAAYL
jgi:hypothetical protein